MKFEGLKASKLFTFLYHPDELLRFKAAEALGRRVRGVAARNYLLRLFWLLSDESGAYCIGAPLAIAEIGRENRDTFESFKNKFVSLLDNAEVERKYVAYGVGRLAEILSDAYPNPVRKLREKIETEDAEFAAYAIISLKKLGDDISDLAEKFGNDRRVVRIYDGKEFVERELRDLL